MGCGGSVAKDKYKEKGGAAAAPPLPAAKQDTRSAKSEPSSGATQQHATAPAQESQAQAPPQPVATAAPTGEEAQVPPPQPVATAAPVGEEAAGVSPAAGEAAVSTAVDEGGAAGAPSCVSLVEEAALVEAALAEAEQAPSLPAEVVVAEAEAVLAEVSPEPPAEEAVAVAEVPPVEEPAPAEMEAPPEEEAPAPDKAMPPPEAPAVEEPATEEPARPAEEPTEEQAFAATLPYEEDPEFPSFKATTMSTAAALLELDRSQGTPLGISVRGAESVLLITRVEKEGMIPDWNVAHPERRVLEGHRIVQVNGLCGIADQLLEELQKETALKIEVDRTLKEIKACLSPDGKAAWCRQQIQEIYERHDEAGLKTLDKRMQTYKNREVAFYRTLSKKFGEEPKDPELYANSVDDNAL